MQPAAPNASSAYDYQGAPLAPPPEPIMSAAPPAAPAMSVVPPPAALPPPASPPPTDPLAPNMSVPEPNMSTPNMSVAPPPPPAADPTINVNSAAPPVSPSLGDFPLHASGGGGVIPAHEVETRGPSLLGAQNIANASTAGAIGNVAGRSEDAAAHEYDMALAQERQARAREAAADASVAERQEELANLQSDFDQSARTLSQTAIDPNHFWATRSTGQKVSAMIGLALGGFLQGARGGSNPGLDAINMAIDRDIHAQEMAYNVNRDVMNGRQTAFALAMQKYNNVDAARSAARAAALDAVQAQVAQTAALWKGTDAANRADIMGAQLQTDRMNQIAQGVRFILPQATARVWYDEHGIPYNDAQARELATKYREFGEKREEIGLNKAGDVIVEGAKAQAAQRAKAGAYPVVLPTGETFFAPSEQDAKEVRALLDTTTDTRRLIAEAKKIRGDAALGVPLAPSSRARLDQIQQELITNFGVQHKLGALSKEDRDMAIGGTADLFRYGPGTDAKLERLGEQATAKLHSTLKTYPGAPAKATGQMPPSTQYHGDK